MSKKVLIANRGEISLRAIRACKELGLKTVCIYSEGDKELKSLRFSDESVCVGPSDPSKSYLDAPTILSAADVTGSDAIYLDMDFLLKITLSPSNVILADSNSLAQAHKL